VSLSRSESPLECPLAISRTKNGRLPGRGATIPLRGSVLTGAKNYFKENLSATIFHALHQLDQPSIPKKSIQDNIAEVGKRFWQKGIPHT
jgi:hypothetical protein